MFGRPGQPDGGFRPFKPDVADVERAAARRAFGQHMAALGRMDFAATEEELKQVYTLPVHLTRTLQVNKAKQQ